MTVIAAWKDKESVWMGGDSGSFEEEEPAVSIGADPKIWRVGENLIGAAGSYRIAEIARKARIGDPHQLRDALHEASIDDTRFPEGWTILVANHKGIYELSDDFAVVRGAENYAAGGANNVATLAAFYALEEWTMTGRKRLNLVLSAVEHHSMYARKPFTILHL